MPPLLQWIAEWSEKYPSSDGVLLPLHGRAAFTLKEIDTIVEWKLQNTPNYLMVARRHLGSLPEGYVLDVTARALACKDDLGAFLILQDLKGVKLAIASAILMTALPERFTVYDDRAKKSLQALNLLQDSPCKGEWLNYLHSCRQIARSTRFDLRTIDRALWAAKGKTGLP